MANDGRTRSPGSFYVSGVRYWRRHPEQLDPASNIAKRDDVHVDATATPQAEVVAEPFLGGFQDVTTLKDVTSI